MILIECPVEVQIRDKAGNELAVIRTGDEEIVELEGLKGCAAEDAKFLMVSQDALDKYDISIKALEEGPMSVTTFDYNGKDGISVNVYSDIALTQDANFGMSLDKGAAGTLSQTENGQDVALEPTVAFNKDVIEELVLQTDASEWARESIATAIAHNLLPAKLMNAFQAEATLENACEAVLNLIESVYGLERGSIAAEFAQADDLNPMIAAAVSYGVLPSEYMDVARSADAAEVPLTARMATTIFANAMGAMDVNVIDSNCNLMVTTEIPEAEYELIYTAFASGILVNSLSENRTYNPEKKLSNEQLVDGISRLWEYYQDYMSRQWGIESLFEETAEGMISIDSGDEYATIYRHGDNDSTDYLVQDFSIYFPSMTEEMWNGSISSNAIIQLVFDFENNYVTNVMPYCTDAASPIDMERLYTNPVSGLELCPVFAAQGDWIAEDGKIYHWVPFYFKTADEEIYEDRIYVLIFAGEDTEDMALLDSKPGTQVIGDTRVEMMVVADQERVAAYLNSYRDIIELYEAPVKEYAELAKGSKGDEVKKLQEELIKQGYLNGKADGDYGNMTVNAVSAFQTANGLEVTGIADNATQQLLFVEIDSSIVLLNWLEAR